MVLNLLLKPTKQKLVLIIALFIAELIIIYYLPYPGQVCMKCINCGCQSQIYYGLFRRVFFYEKNSVIILLISMVFFYLISSFIYYKRSKNILNN